MATSPTRRSAEGSRSEASKAAVDPPMSSEEAASKAEQLKAQLARMRAAIASKKTRKRKIKDQVGDNRLNDVPLKSDIGRSEEVDNEQMPGKKQRKSYADQRSVAPDTGHRGDVVNPYLAHLSLNNGDNSGRSSERSYDRDIEGDFDSHWERKRALHEQRAFKILPQGKFIEAAAVCRAKEAHRAFVRDRRNKDARRHFKQLLSQRTIGAAAPQSDSNEKISNNGGVASDAAVPISAFVHGLTKHAPAPELEWWDKAFEVTTAPSKRPRLEEDAKKNNTNKDIEEDGGNVSGQNSSSAALETITERPYRSLRIQNEKTYKLVQHPASVPSLLSNKTSIPMPLYTTKDERKRLRRQTRRAREQREQDKIAAGLIPPPQPKVKLSNMMRVLGDVAVADPSKLEAYVREETAKRVHNHTLRNEASKLTPLEKYQKQQKRIAEDVSRGLFVSVYRILELCEPPDLAASNRFKLDVHAQKLGITGCVLIPSESVEGKDGVMRKLCGMIAEGGAKALRYFDKEVNRIKFPSRNCSDGSLEEGCTKMWHGKVTARIFPKRLEFHDLDLKALQQFIRKHGLGHFWEFVVNAPVLE